MKHKRERKKNIWANIMHDERGLLDKETNILQTGDMAEHASSVRLILK